MHQMVKIPSKSLKTKQVIFIAGPKQVVANQAVVVAALNKAIARIEIAVACPNKVVAGAEHIPLPEESCRDIATNASAKE